MTGGNERDTFSKLFNRDWPSQFWANQYFEILPRNRIAYKGILSWKFSSRGDTFYFEFEVADKIGGGAISKRVEKYWVRAGGILGKGGREGGSGCWWQQFVSGPFPWNPNLESHLTLLGLKVAQWLKWAMVISQESSALKIDGPILLGPGSSGTYASHRRCSGSAWTHVLLEC